MKKKEIMAMSLSPFLLIPFAPVISIIAIYLHIKCNKKIEEKQELIFFVF